MQPNTDPLDQLFARLTVQYCLNLRMRAMRTTVRHARTHTDPFPANRARSIIDLAKALQERHALCGSTATYGSTAWLVVCGDGRLLLSID